jgi:hypothetical protein
MQEFTLAGRFEEGIPYSSDEHDPKRGRTITACEASIREAI